jgi:hypothetical protein
MFHMTLLGRFGVAFLVGFGLLLPSPASAGSEMVTTVTLPPNPTLTVPTLSVPTLQTPQLPVSGGSSSSGAGTLTVPTIPVPQLQVPTIQVPQLQIPTMSVPQLQIPTLVMPSLVAPDMPTLTVPPVAEIASTPPVSTPRRDRQGSSQATPRVVTPQVSGLISPEMLLEMLRVQQAETTLELVAPQEATTTNRLPIGTFAAFGGGVVLVSFALSLLRRRNDLRTSSEAAVS